MAIVAGFDVHRAQITFDALDTDTGEVMRGRDVATCKGILEERLVDVPQPAKRKRIERVLKALAKAQA